MKTLVTHVRPHLDDICALWLLRKYWHPDAKDAKIEFIKTNERGGDVADDEHRVYVGVGRGRFDEHKGDIGQCATTLVFDFLNKREPFEHVEHEALKKIVAWVLEEDTGKLNAVAYRDFMVPLVLKGHFDNKGGDSMAITELGFTILDALLTTQKNLVKLEADWKDRIEFDSRYGRAVALASYSQDIDSYAYSRGFVLAVYVNPDLSYHNIRAQAHSPVDLTPAFEKLKAMDPEAGWYLHHSKKMIICGGEITSGVHPSKLTLQQLMDSIK